jgi:Peptidase S24-like
MNRDTPQAALDSLIKANGDDYAALSRLVGRNAAYIQQFIKRGSPKILGERERAILARYFGVDETLLGAPQGAGRRNAAQLHLVSRLAVGASAGPGAVPDSESLAGKVGFDEKWLRRMGVHPAKLTLIRVEGDSMAPTLNHNDDIMVDSGAAMEPLREAIYVIRLDDTLMVKRLALGPQGSLSILSDNPAYPNWDKVDAQQVSVVGRVVWIGRKL